MTPAKAIALCLAAYAFFAVTRVVGERNGVTNPDFYYFMGMMAVMAPVFLALKFKRLLDAAPSEGEKK